MRLQTTEDIIAQPQIMEKAVEEHDRWIGSVMRTWRDVRDRGDEGVRELAEIALTLCVMHLQWTMNTERYVAHETRGLLEKRY